MRRRDYIQTAVATVSLLGFAGCGGNGGDDGPTPETSTDGRNSETSDETATSDPDESNTSSTISSTFASGGITPPPPKAERVGDRTEELVEYLNGRVTGHTFEYTARGNSGVDAGPVGGREEAFVGRVLTNLDDEDGLDHAEIVTIAHDRDDWGYGRKIRKELGDRTVWGCLVLASENARPWETDGFTWHEVGHAFGAKHHEGSIALDSENRMHQITPMCMSYVKSRGGNPDTAIQALDGYPVACFNRRSGGHLRPSNYQYLNPVPTGAPGDREANHDIDRFSDEVLGKVRRWTRAYPGENGFASGERRLSNASTGLEAQLPNELRESRPYIQYFKQITRRRRTYTKPNFETVPYPEGVDEKLKMTSVCGYERASVDGVEGRTIHRRFESGGQLLDDVTFVGALSDEPVFVVEQQFTTPMDESLHLDTPDNFIARGVGVGKLGVDSPSGTYRFHVDEWGTERFADHGRWDTFPFDTDHPFITAFDDDRGVTLGVIEAPNGPSMGMTSTLRGGTRLIRLFVSGFTVPSDGTRSLRLAVAPHGGGDDAPEAGAGLVETARSRF